MIYYVPSQFEILTKVGSKQKQRAVSPFN